MSEFLIYRSPGGLVRAKIVKRFKNGRIKIEPYFFQKNGRDTGILIGGRFTINPGQVERVL